MDNNQKEYEIIENAHTYTILGCFETNNPQNIFVRSPSLNEFAISSCKIFMIIIVIAIIEVVILFGGWGICRASFGGAVCGNNSFWGYLIFIFTANAGAFMGGVVVCSIFLAIMHVFCCLHDEIININKELHDQNNVSGEVDDQDNNVSQVDNQVDVQLDV